MRRRQLTADQQRELITRGGSLAALTQHPSWPVLVDEIHSKEERLRKRAASNALATTGANQRELDYVRGFIDGMEYLIKIPAGAESRLENYLREHAVEGAAT